MGRFMKLWCESLWVFLCCQQFILCNDDGQEHCDIGGLKGLCVALPDCGRYANLLKNSETFLEGLKTVQERSCGFDGPNMKVCCPMDTPVVTTTEDPESSDFVSWFPVPGECGCDTGPSGGYSPYGLGMSGGYQGVSNYWSNIGSNSGYQGSIPNTPPSPPSRPVAGGEPVADRWSITTPPPPPAGGMTPPIRYDYPIAGGYPVGERGPYTFDHNHNASFSGLPVIAGGMPVGSYDTRPPVKPTTPVAGGWPVPQRQEEPIAGGYLVDEYGRYRDPYNPIKTNLNNTNEAPAISGGNPVGPNYGEIPVGIAGGEKVTTRELALWMALLGYKGADVFWQCGGSIITAKHVLSAAHCIKRNLYIVRVGELNLAGEAKEFGPIDILVKKTIIHEHYTKFHNDIAVIVLQSTIDFAANPHIAPVCLASSQQDDVVAKLLREKTSVVTGWGETEQPGVRPSQLLYAVVLIQDQETCSATYKNRNVTIDARVLCAGDSSNQRDACNGDSGGPLVAPTLPPGSFKSVYYQLGVVSYGFACNKRRYSGVYTNVTHFLPWIQEKVLGRRLDL